MEKNHPLRDAVAAILEKRLSELSDESVELVKADHSEARIPLYFVDETGRTASYCNVDLLILKDDRIKIILEIDEAGVDPIRICGNYLTSTFSQFHFHRERDGGRRVAMGDSVAFFQIINAPRLGAYEDDRLIAIEKAIRSNSTRDSQITEYQIFLGKTKDFQGDDTGLVSAVKRALNQPRENQRETVSTST